MQSIYKLFKESLEDLLVLRGAKKPAHNLHVDFVFIVHPRHRKDIEKYFPVFKKLPDNILRFIISFMWPVRVHRIKAKYNNKIYTGYTVGVLLLPDQMLKNRKLAVKKISQALKLGEKFGARIGGLGALTPSVTRGGEVLSKKGGISVTNGYPTTVKAVSDTALSLIDKGGLSMDNLNLAIVGAAGSVGSNVARMLSKNNFKNIYLIDKKDKTNQLKELTKELKQYDGSSNIVMTHDVKEVSSAHIIVTATNANEFILKNEHISAGTLVVDDAQPSDVSPDVISDRDDVLVTEAGIIYDPNTEVKPNIELASKHDLFSCLAEVIMLTVNEHTHDDFSVGRLDFSKVEEVEQLMQNTAFRVGEYQNYTGVITDDHISNVLNILKNRDGLN